MKTAQTFGNLSTAVRKKVGAIIVKDDRIISIGYNGTPSGWSNICEDVIQHSDDTTTLKTKAEVVHAEMNAIAKLAKSTESGDGAYMFITCSPCMECAKMIAQSGIKKVFYDESYRSNDGIDFLNKCSVEVEKVDING